MKVLAIASAGGHWVQLLRLTPAFDGCETTYISTKPDFEKMVPGKSFYAINDANRKDKIKLILAFFSIINIVLKVKPDVVITTGAAPGLIGIIVGRFLGIKTIWVDSIANVETLSLSGKLAIKFADRVYTQWPDLANSKVIFHGNVLL